MYTHTYVLYYIYITLYVHTKTTYQKHVIFNGDGQTSQGISPWTVRRGQDGRRYEGQWAGGAQRMTTKWWQWVQWFWSNGWV